MKKIITIAAIAAVIFACNEVRKETTPKPPSVYNLFCNTPGHGDSLCAQLPFDVNEKFGFDYNSFLDSVHQPPFDVFSWQTFVAINWPADASGKPTGTSIASSPNALRVWEYYSDPAEIFGHPVQSLMLHLGKSKENGQKFLYMDSKAPNRLQAGNVVDMSKFHEADGHPLIDRNLNFALYEIKMNPIETRYIVDSSLTTLQGIYAYSLHNGNAINLPHSDSLHNNVGSMEVKASWRILVPSLGDDTTRFYCRTATIFIDSPYTRNHKQLLITNVKVGLVGMHIIRKTATNQGKEIWSTFEHVDNTPDNPQEAQMSDKKWSFYNPQCLGCIPNAIPDTIKGDNGQYIWDTSMPYARRYGVTQADQQAVTLYGTQAVRVFPIYKYTELLNQVWRDKLKGTVWANYRLIGSQWQIDMPNGNRQPIAPNYLGNTTLETYIQSSASCIGCHGSYASVTFNKTTITTNLSFIFPVYARDTSKKK